MPKKSHFEIAIEEIGTVEPWWSEEDDMFIFEHPKYSRVLGGGLTKEEAIQSYIRALSGFINDRLAGLLAPEAEKVTKGHGGKRVNSGRKGVKNSVRIRVAPDIADWVKNPANFDKVRALMLEEARQANHDD